MLRENYKSFIDRHLLLSAIEALTSMKLNSLNHSNESRRDSGASHSPRSSRQKAREAQTRERSESGISAARTYLLYLPALLLLISCGTAKCQDIPPNRVVPTERQIEYQEMEVIGFIHFNINTFTGKEWGYGNEDPKLFNPTELDAEQWARVAKESGIKELILTAKHHDGFCLWPSAYTKHSIKYSLYKNGKGDIVREFVNACRKYGIKAGLYLSPWDRHRADYGTPKYITYYENQLKELLTNYGKIDEVWFDGANGGDGYYGGANEKRIIDRKKYYPWKEIWGIVRELQPNALIFSDAGPDIRWIGNENGHAGKTFWSTINADTLFPGTANPEYLNTGDPNGKMWVVGEADVSIRPGWFYHREQDSLVKSPQELVDIYYKSVGRNAVMLLNIPPDTRGLIADKDIKALKEFREILSETFKKNLAYGAKATASDYRMNLRKFSPNNILDDNNSTYWATDDTVRQATIEVDLDSLTEFDRIMLQEPIRFGQRISSFEIQVLIQNKWESVAHGTTIGYKRLLRIHPVKTNKVQILIHNAISPPTLSNFGLFKASAKE
jgi:alpha-L-fucosidase